jgi:FkbM family methyltransferase
MSFKILMRKARVALTPGNCLLKTKLSNDAIVFGKNRPGYGGRGVYIFRDSLEPEFEHLLELLTPSGVFVDVGANTGIYTIKSAKYLSKSNGQVVALEPFPEMLAMLQYNVQANGLNNVRLRNFCAGDHTHAAVFWRNYEKPNSFSLVRRDDKATSFSVLVVALDDLFAWEGLSRLDYLKIDAEGAEQEIISGAKSTIEKHRPIIQVEINLKDAEINLPNYSAFQAALGSINRLLIPNESPKINIPPKLGWIKVASRT